MKKEYGIDTFSLRLTKQRYHAADSVIEEINDKRYERELHRDKHNLNKFCELLEFNDCGIRLNVHANPDFAGGPN